MKWTKEQPTLEGFYWVRSKEDRFKPEVMEVTLGHGGREVHIHQAGNNVFMRLAEFDATYEWCGPLPLPEPK